MLAASVENPFLSAMEKDKLHFRLFAAQCFALNAVQGLQIVRRLVHAQLSSLSTLEFDARVGNEMNELLRLYLRYHFDGLKPLKSAEFFQQQHISTM